MQLTRGTERILIIPDMQLPFQHQDAFTFLKTVNDVYQPTKVVSIGDSLDNHTLGKFISNPNGYSAADEFDKAVSLLHNLYDIFPVVTEVESNHNRRIIIRARTAGLPDKVIRPYNELTEAPSTWKFVEYLILDNIMFEHGDAVGGMYASRNAALTNGRSTIIGHHHSHASLYYISNREKMYFGMNVGCLIDLYSYAFEYAKKYKFKPTLSCGFVNKGIPQIIPMVVNSDNRWDGEII